MKTTIEVKILRQIAELLRQQNLGLELASLIDNHLLESHKYLLETVGDYLSNDISKADLASAVATEQRAVLTLSFPEI